MPSLLDALRGASAVDCDCLDSQVAKALGPFVDCTSNQAIAFFELSRPVTGEAVLHHAELIRSAVEDACGGLKHLRGTATPGEFAVEILMVKLQLQLLPHTTGYLHVQTNPKLSYATKATIQNAERIVAIFAALNPTFDIKRVCIKIPATWQGLQACRALEEKGVATLATTMFCMEQAALAADVKCTYIAPYVNELKVHFEKGYVDENKAFDFCREAQAFYRAFSHRTLVLAASLTSVDEVMQLAGLDHITISPALLQQLSARDLATWSGKMGEYVSQGPAKRSWETINYANIVSDEASWNMAFTRSGFGTSQGKIVQAINYFADFQDQLEALVAKH